MSKSLKPDISNATEESFKIFLAKNVKEKEKQVRKMLSDNQRLRKECKSLYEVLINVAEIIQCDFPAKTALSSSQSISKMQDRSYIDGNIRKIKDWLQSSYKPKQLQKKNQKSLTSSTGSPKKQIDHSIVSINSSNQNHRLKQKYQNTLIMVPKIKNSFCSDTLLPQQTQPTIAIEEYQSKLAQLKNINDENVKLKNEAYQLSSKLGKMESQLKIILKKFKQIKNELYILKINSIGNIRNQQKDILKLIEMQRTKYLKEIQEITIKFQVNKQINSINDNILIKKMMEKVQKLKNHNFSFSFDSKLKNYGDDQLISQMISIIYPKMCQQFRRMLTELNTKAQVSKVQLKLSRQHSKKQTPLKQKTMHELKQELQQKIIRLKIDLQATESLNSGQLLAKYPKLCFMSSNILPSLSVDLSENQREVIDQSQEFILDSIVNYYKKSRRIIGLKQLYSYKVLNRKVNFHLMIDNHPHILLLIKLKKSDSMLVVYSQRGIQQDENYSPENKSAGFLLDMLTKKLYLPRQKYHKNQIMPNQQYFIVVGNHDLKIRLDSNEIQSCFGSQMSMFRPNSDYTVDNILHDGQSNTTPIVDYEFYQILFK